MPAKILLTFREWWKKSFLVSLILEFSEKKLNWCCTIWLFQYNWNLFFERAMGPWWVHDCADATLLMLIVDRKIRSSHPCILAKEMAHNILESPSSVDIYGRAEFLNESWVKVFPYFASVSHPSKDIRSEKWAMFVYFYFLLKLGSEGADMLLLGSLKKFTSNMNLKQGKNAFQWTGFLYVWCSLLLSFFVSKPSYCFLLLSFFDSQPS